MLFEGDVGSAESRALIRTSGAKAPFGCSLDAALKGPLFHRGQIGHECLVPLKSDMNASSTVKLGMNASSSVKKSTQKVQILIDSECAFRLFYAMF
jgi:hypothetical protein